ncbi:MAG: hypothetical protein WBB39_00240 [Candidatus Saccharimonadales bacterium]
MAWPKIKISPHHHTGKLRSHDHTSYAMLSLLLMVAAVPLIAYTASAKAPYDGPEAGSIGLTGVVPGKPPATGAIITSPSNGQRFSATPITVTGTCPAKTLVEVFKNDIFSGSSPCSDSGTFTMQMDLLIGKNDLIARVYDDLNQPGPDSPIVTVYYDALPTQAGPVTSLDFGGVQLLLNTDAVFRGVFPNKEMSMPIEVIGGTPPYAVNIQWGDATNTVVSRTDNSPFRTTHVYKKPGVNQITIQASDAVGRVAFLTVAAIINGQPDTVQTTAATQSQTNILLALWPLYVGIVGMVLSFWIGEKRERHILEKRGQLLPI